jgi:hypothetical protein
MIPDPQFTAELLFHFREHGPDRRHWFMFDESCHRRVPMRMDGVDGLNTVGMWTDTPNTFKAGDSVIVRCFVIAPELFGEVLQSGVRFELWDGGFLASGIVLKRVEKGWPK